MTTRFLSGPGARAGRLLLLLALAVLAACSSNKAKDEAAKPAELVKFTPEFKLKALWSRGVGDGQGSKYNRLQPAIDDDYVYVADASGKIMALERDTGQRVWRVKLKKTDITGAVGVGFGTVVVGTSDGEVIALERGTGEVLWRVRVGGEILAPPVTDGDVVVAQSFDGKLHALNAFTGEPLWQYTSQIPVLTLRGTAAPVLDIDRVYAAFANGKLVSIELRSGAVAWESRVALAQGNSEIDRVVDVDGTPLVTSNAVFAVSYQGRAGAFDPASGRPFWYQEASSYVGMVEGFGNVYYATAGGSVVALDQRSGSQRWENAALANRRLNQPAVVGNYLVVSDFEGYVHVLSQVDGSFVARRKLGSKGVRAPILAEDGVIYVFGNKGKLAAYEIQD